MTGLPALGPALRPLAACVAVLCCLACSEDARGDGSSAALSDAHADDAPAADAGALVDGSVDTTSGAKADGAASDAAPSGDGAATGDADGARVGDVGAGSPINVGSWTPEKDDGTWPIAPWVAPDGRVWLPTRTIADGQGGELVLRNAPPLRKPYKTAFSERIHRAGVVQVKFIDGAAMSWKAGVWSSSGAGGDPSVTQAAIDGLNKRFAGLAGLGTPARMFLGKPAALAAERLALEQLHKRAMPDLGAFYLVPVQGNVGQVADVLNGSPLVELAWPVALPQLGAVEAMSGSTADDKNIPTPDFTPYQGYLLRTDKTSKWGGHDATLPWNFPGGRGETVPAAQIESKWNLDHEDLQVATGALYSSYDGGKKTSLDAGTGPEHAQAVLGILKAKNNGYGTTGLATAAQIGLMPSDPDDQDDWLDADPALKTLANDGWGGFYAAKIQYLAGKLQAGATIFFSLGIPAPTHRYCEAESECSPRVACLPAPPYELAADGKPERRCEGFDGAGVANNGCKTDQDCHTRWGFGARCLPLNKASVAAATAPFASKIWANWRCAGDPNGRVCTTSSDCTPISRCEEDTKGTERCGGAIRPAMLANHFTLGPATKSAGNTCQAHSDCTPSGDSTCNKGFCTWLNESFRARRLAPFEVDPGLHAAIKYAGARGITVIQAATNEHQRLGLLTEDAYAAGGATKVFNGHDTYIGLYDCPLPGCRPATGGWLIAATDGGEDNKASWTTRGPAITFNSWGARVATLAYGDLHNDRVLDKGGALVGRHDYTSTFSGTSSATPIIAGLVLQLQGMVKAHTGKLLPTAVLREALHAGGTLTDGHAQTDHAYVAVRPNLANSISYLEAGGYVAQGTSAIKDEDLVVEDLAATRFSPPGGTKQLVVTMRVRNKGERISPPVGLILRTGTKAGGAAGAQQVVLSSCFDNNTRSSCCSASSTNPDCKMFDLDAKQVHVPFLNGTKTGGKSGGSVDLAFRVIEGVANAGTVCVELDNDLSATPHARLASKPAVACATVRELPDAVGVTGGFQLRGLVFKSGDPVTDVCGKDWGLPATALVGDIAVVTRKQTLVLAAFPHSGTIGVVNVATSCLEMDFAPADPSKTCGATGSTNRLAMGPAPIGTGGCDAASIKAALGYNPTSIAVTRDQRFAAVALANLQDPCAAGRLALIDLRKPNKPRVFTHKVGGKDVPVYVPVGPNPVSVAITHEGQHDARIVVAARSNWTKCTDTPRVNIIKLADIIKQGPAAPVSKRFFPIGKDPHRVVIDNGNLAAWVAMDYIGAPIGMLRLSDLKAFSLTKKKNTVLGWNRVRAIAAVKHADGLARVLLVEQDFAGTKDTLGNVCPTPAIGCGGLHWLRVNVGDKSNEPVVDYPGTGAILQVHNPTDLALSEDLKHALIPASAWWVQHVALGGPTASKYGFANLSPGKATKAGGLQRLVRVPDPDPGFCPDEVCNSKDDDCDGVPDQFWPTLGDTCTVGKGVCQANGKRICEPSFKLSTICDATPAAKQLETCNGVDDDCDGTIDNPWHTILGKPCWVGKGACNTKGKRVCKVDGTGWTCDAKAGKPGKELCGNGEDDDCDGLVDNGCN